MFDYSGLTNNKYVPRKLIVEGKILQRVPLEKQSTM